VFRLLKAYRAEGATGMILIHQPDQQRERQTPAQRSIVGEAYRQHIAGYDAPKAESTPASERARAGQRIRPGLSGRGHRPDGVLCCRIYAYNDPVNLRGSATVPFQVDKRSRDPGLQCVSSADPACLKSDCLGLPSL
jgi:hypothetical protein